MRKEIANPFMFKDCFFCGSENPEGLKLHFYWDEESNKVYTELVLSKRFAGQGNIIHGGFQMGVLDEIMGWTAVYLTKQMVVTSDINIKFIKPLYVGEKITAASNMISCDGPKVLVEAELQNAKGDVCTAATGTFHILSKQRYESIIDG